MSWMTLAQGMTVEPLPLWVGLLVYGAKVVFDSGLKLHQTRNGKTASNGTKLPCDVHDTRIEALDRRLTDYQESMNRRIDELKEQSQRNFTRLFERLDQMG